MTDDAELLVDIGDGSLNIGDGDDGVLIEGELLINLAALLPDLFRKRNNFRDQWNEHRRGDQRHRCRARFDDPRQQIIGVPDVPDLHQVGCAASQDEDAEHPEDAIEGQTASLADEIDENDRNAGR